MTDLLCDKYLSLFLHGGPIRDWMDIMDVDIPLDRIYKLTPDGREVETIKCWRENVIVPGILKVLEWFCHGKGIEGFSAFEDACYALPDPSAAFVFTPPDNPHWSLPPHIIHWRIDALCIQLPDVEYDAAHCLLGICLVDDAE